MYRELLLDLHKEEHKKKSKVKLIHPKKKMHQTLEEEELDDTLEA